MSVEYAKLVLVNEPLYFLQSLYSMHKLKRSLFMLYCPLVMLNTSTTIKK